VLRGNRRILRGPGRGLTIDVAGSRPSYVLGTDERLVQAVLAERLQAGDVLYDLGANVGFLTLIAARLVGPTGRVVAYEPIPGSAEAVRRNASLNGFGHVDVVEAAVGDRAGTTRMTLSRSSLEAHATPEGELEVPMVTLDEEVASGRPGPTLLKIDVEGAETAVVEGAAGVLRDHRPVVVCEIHESLHLREHPVEGHLKAAGYTVRWLERDAHSGRPFWAPHLLGIPPGA
jgi:FkbM family methyltransferase